MGKNGHMGNPEAPTPETLFLFHRPWWWGLIIWGAVAVMVFPFAARPVRDAVVTSLFVGALVAAPWWALWAFCAGKLDPSTWRRHEK